MIAVEVLLDRGAGKPLEKLAENYFLLAVPRVGETVVMHNGDFYKVTNIVHRGISKLSIWVGNISYPSKRSTDF